MKTSVPPPATPIQNQEDSRSPRPVRLACDGGPPIRTEPLPPRFVGAGLIGAEEKALVDEVVDAQSLFRHYGAGIPHFADDLEREFRDYVGAKYALATATGSGAYFCAMRALEVGPGDEVVIPAFGWITDYAMVDSLGATPVFTRIDESMNLSPEDFRAKITERTKAVVVVHYQGGAARVDDIVEIAHRRGINVFEDVAQACGGEFGGRKLGTWGDIACYSFQNNKTITCGDGGMLVTDDQRRYELAVRYHDLGLLREGFEANLEGPVITVPIAGMQWRMGELAAAAGLAQLRKLPGIVSVCRTHARFLRDRLKAEFPDLRFRAVEAGDDMGVLVAFDLESADREAFFHKAYEAEGLPYGPTSWCETLCDIPQVAARMQKNGVYDQATFDATRAQDARMAKLAVIPAYSRSDMEDIAAAAGKVLRAMVERGMTA